ncbi:MAG: holo-[acyl-carrier-protein] synthase [Proteobacteria bacterium]|nr:holo-[acyl-carrier-protein] synthase [Pseudomonadota bacterium]
MVGVGTDICRVERVERVLEKFGTRFLQRVLTPAEREQKEWNAAALARRWALKEAVAKACRTGIGGAVGFHDIEVRYDAAKAPHVQVRGTAEGLKVWGSVSDDAGLALAFAVVEKRD